MKRGGGRRYYRPEDINLLFGIKYLLYEQGLTIRGSLKVIQDKGTKFVTKIGSENKEQKSQLKKNNLVASKNIFVKKNKYLLKIDAKEKLHALLIKLEEKQRKIKSRILEKMKLI